MNDRNNLINKILNLLNRTQEKGATKAEAEAALKIAAELMAKYEITELDLKKADRNFFKDGSIKLFRMDITSLFTKLANTFDCEFYYYSVIKEGHFFGFEIDVKLCIHFAEMLSSILAAEIRKYKNSDRYKDLVRTYQEKLVVKNFVKGFYLELADKLDEVKRNKEKIILSSGTSLMVIKAQQVKEEFDILHSKIKTVEDKAFVIIKSALLDGTQKANNVQFNNPIEKGTEDLLLLNTNKTN